MAQTIVRMYGGEQDGLAVPADKTPNVLWVPTIQEQRRHEARQKLGHEIHAEDFDDDQTLPYVKFRTFRDHEDNVVCDYEFCEDLLVHNADQDYTP